MSLNQRYATVYNTFGMLGRLENSMSVNSFYDWMQLRYTAGELHDIVEHGAEQGIPGLTYYNETARVYDEWETEMWEHLGDISERVNLDVLELLSARWRQNVHSHTQFVNCVVWSVAEHLACCILADGAARSDVEEPPTEERVSTKLGALAAALQRQIDERMEP